MNREPNRGSRPINNGQIPQRVENAAQSMMNQASSGPRRGYIPPDTGRMQPMNGWQQTGGQGYYAQNPQQPFYTGQSPVTGSQRGFIMPPAQNNRPKEPKKSHKGLIAFLVILLLIFIAASVISHRANGNQMTSSGQLIAKSGNSIAQKSPYVGELHIEGEIASGTPQSADYTTYDQNWLLDMIDQMKNDPNNRGLILYVNSPGGSTNATDELYLKVKDYKEETKRPVYTYMADEGASGAYYIAAASDRIYVNRNCWTGSIGVRLSTIYDVTGLMKKLGVKAETIHAGKNKNMGSVTEKLTGQQRKILQGLVDDAYDQFVQIVADGRSMPVSDVRKLADGRVYTAKQAKANGLVDGIVLSYDDAEKQMKKNGGLVGVRTMEILHPTVSYGILDYLTGKAEVTKDGKSRVSGENEKSSEAALLEKLLEENGSYTLSYLSDIRK